MVAPQQLVAHFKKPPEQRNVQVPASQIAVPPAGTGQTVQLAPQAVALGATHVPPHARKPALHVIPQLVPLHVAAPFGGTGHATHEVPQLAVLVFETH